MDAAEAELDIKLQKISSDLLVQFDQAISMNPEIVIRKVADNLFKVLDPFQELPQLLDPHLPKWIPFLSETYLELLLQGRSQRARNGPSGNYLASAEYAICKLLYTFSKIRGEKVIVRFLNVEAKYLELLTSAVEEAEVEDQKEQWAWEQRYVVLLWISHLLLAPFDLSTISSVDKEDMVIPRIEHFSWPDGLPGIAVRVILLGLKYLSSPGRERDAAKAVLVRIAMRRDMQQLGLLDSLISWALRCLRPGEEDTEKTAYYYLGILSFLAGALRSSSDTSDMDKHLQPIFETVHSISSDEAPSAKSIMSLALARKMALKVMRTVVVSLLRQPEQTDASTEMTETAIGHLLESVADNDTPVRLLASKSLSIITLKLDPFMASQVVEAVLDSLNRNVLWTQPAAGSGAKSTRDLSAVNSLEWHGLMLTLSHLLYRRSPPAAQLPDIVHALLLGLSFEQRSTSGGSVGSNVRDAACFGIWAIARRYSTEELLLVSTQSVLAAKSHDPSSSIIQVLATELVTTACLDPAGNIRRGASAALQELIGRHPNTIDEGIGVVQTVDYHAVARRSRAMADVAHGASRLSIKYGEAVTDGILGWRGIGDADAASRRDAAHGYGRLVAEMAAATSNPVSRLRIAALQIHTRLKQLAQRQVEERHGLLLCYAAIVDKMADFMQGGTVEEPLGPEACSEVISSVTSLLRELGTVTFRRPELVAEGSSILVVALIPLLQALLLKDFTKTMPKLPEYLSARTSRSYMAMVEVTDHETDGFPAIADFTSALSEAIPSWLARNEQEAVAAGSQAAVTLLIFSRQGDRISKLRKWTDAIRSKPTSRKSEYGDGYLHALAVAQPLAKATVEPAATASSDIVSQAFLDRWAADEDIDTRVAILQSLTKSHMLLDEPSLFVPLLVEGLNDYTTNARGDVGSHVRVQALRAVQALWASPQERDSGVWSSDTLSLLFGDVLRLAAEKLDKVRSEAQTALGLSLAHQYRKDFLAMTFSSKSYFSTLLNLVAHHEKFIPQVRQFLSLQPHPLSLSASLLAGFVTSADTGNEDLVISSRAALCDYIDESAPEAASLTIGNALLLNLRTNQSRDRVVIPTLEVIAFLLRVKLLGVHQAGDNGDNEDQQPLRLDLKSLCLQTQKAGYKSGSVRKLEACVKVYGGIAASRQEDAAREARKRLGALLFHPWPKVRSTVVDELWGLLEVLGENSQRSEKRAEQLLGVDWGKASKAQLKELVENMGLA
ncbi:beta-tubulin cofactor d [Sarocladium implicatum]|nr:beta-tubulin cofactor d [Sarocladium implicatum]